jgi:formylglycine-generating enzyme required for sulfatase activity
MKKTAALFAIALALLGHQSLHAQGSLAPDSNPKPTQKSLQEIWQKIEATENRVLILGQTTNSTALQVQTLGQTANSTVQQVQTLGQTGNSTAQQVQTLAQTTNSTAQQVQALRQTANSTAQQVQTLGQTTNSTTQQLQILSQTVDALAQIVRQGPAAPGMVTVQGGTLRTSNTLNGTVVASFQIGKYEVRWDEWQEVRTWALANGYGNFTTGNRSAADHPVRNVNWYDAVKYCNARSEREGLVPVYSVNGTIYRTGNFIPTANSSSNGYRLPTEAEWEWAARGGVLSQGYIYSGSSILTHVGWFTDNSGGASVNLFGGKGTWPVGQKAANELGLHDMSGNVSEWCWTIINNACQIRGGGWFSEDHNAAVNSQFNQEPFSLNNNYGFRLARNAGN